MAGLVEFQRLTGCRPGEACGVRRSDLDESGPVWLYRPPHHKNAHRGQTRTTAVGPKAQAVLQGFFTSDRADPLFSPAGAMAELQALAGGRPEDEAVPVAPGPERGEAGEASAAPAGGEI